ncbi:glycosyltransferase [Streptosporangiaceae bacterium NEAU-GS5]|nr:glycosyltransferase [Streptosporangiaceae bacterium NEAU-GS5]
MTVPTMGSAAVTTVSITGRTYTEGVAVVMPAYGEEDNIEATVEDFLRTLAGTPHKVIVVDDGSLDRTGEILDRLAERHPDHVIAAHHLVNRGYGAAVRSGITLALESTDLRRLLLTDSDGQFKAEDLPIMLKVQRTERADGVIGYRRHRADPPMRRINAFIWSQLSRLLLGTRSRDVDCAYKLLDRRLLDGVHLRGEAAAISPELLAKIRGTGTRIIEHPVGHYPRRHGDQTGARLSVILRSLVSLAAVYRDLVRDGRRWGRARRLLKPADPVLAMITLGAVVLSVVATVHYMSQDLVLSYKDAVSHVLIARRVVDSPTNGVAQLGGVWLPLPHLLAVPLVWIQAMYETGLASSVVSMIAYVVTVRYVYKLATAMAGLRFSGNRVAGIAAAAVFGLNPNVLYLQATPMTEALLFACIAGAVYHLNEWCRTGRYVRLAVCSAWVALASLTRYEGWVLCLAVTAVVGYTALRRWRGYTRIEANLIFFGVVAYSGIIGWLGWNGIIFGNPLYWQTGEYAKPSLWVSAGDRTVGDIVISAKTYLIAMVDDIGWATLALGFAGLLLYAFFHRLAAATAAPYTLVVFLPFYIYTLYAGQRPLHVTEIHGDLYNVRFGLVMALATAVFAGYVVRLAAGAVAVRVAVAGTVAASVFAVSGTATLAEPVAYLNSKGGRIDVGSASWLREHYDGGMVLMQNFGNELVVFGSRLPLGQVLYEGSFRKWEPALADPAGRDVRWIYMRSSKGAEDGVYRALYGTARLRDRYELLYQDADRLIYREKP